MRVIVFSKLLKPYTPEQLLAFAKAQKIDGFDLAVRDGYPVNPENIEQALVPFAKQAKAVGLSVPLVTLGGLALDPKAKSTEAAWAACGQAGVEAVKLGYWLWKPGEHYWTKVKEIRAQLADYAVLAKKYGVKAVFHTHSDPYYGINASALMHLLDGLDPNHVAAYLDPAHLGLDGEPLDMALDMLRGRLGMVAVKNSHVTKTPNGWMRGFCRLPDGLVDWTKALRQIKASGFTGALSVHGEYDHRDSMEEALDFLIPDLAWLRQTLATI